MTFEKQIRELANTANNRLAAALDAQKRADREVTEALTEQRSVMAALRAVTSDDYESTRGATLESRCEGHAFLDGDQQ